MSSNQKTRRAFTLVEMLITLSIFGIVGVLCTYTLISAVRSAKKIQAESYLYSEAQILMDQIARDIERSAVDYEAYYLRYGIDARLRETGWATTNYGFYAQTFYNPGDDGVNADGPFFAIKYLNGANCADGTGSYPDDCPGVGPVASELDSNVGSHPFSSGPYAGSMSDLDSTYPSDSDDMNAFCEDVPSGTTTCGGISDSLKDELILVNPSGDERSIYLLTPFSNGSTENRMAKMKMSGTDSDMDGVVDLWACSSSYVCTNTGNTPRISDFLPITPSPINVQEFYVYITPLEDPYRAVAEATMQSQPQITIVLTVSLSDDYANGLLGESPTITMERTVSTGVYSKIESY